MSKFAKDTTVNLDRTIDEVELLKRYREGTLNFVGVTLSIACLSNVDLAGADFTAADLNNANFMDANLPGACFRKANLQGSLFSGANLQGASLAGADLSQSFLTGANLRRVNLYMADLRNADLSGADLTSASLEGSDLRGANLSGAVVDQAALSTTQLDNAILPNGDRHVVRHQARPKQFPTETMLEMIVTLITTTCLAGLQFVLLSIVIPETSALFFQRISYSLQATVKQMPAVREFFAGENSGR